MHDSPSGMCRAMCRRGSGSTFHRRMVDTCFSTNLSRRCDFAVGFLQNYCLGYFVATLIIFREMGTSLVQHVREFKRISELTGQLSGTKTRDQNSRWCRTPVPCLFSCMRTWLRRVLAPRTRPRRNRTGVQIAREALQKRPHPWPAQDRLACMLQALPAARR